MGSRNDAAFEVAKRFNQELGKRGWIAPPGRRSTAASARRIFEQFIFNEEFGYYGAPDTGTAASASA